MFCNRASGMLQAVLAERSLGTVSRKMFLVECSTSHVQCMLSTRGSRGYLRPCPQKSKVAWLVPHPRPPPKKRSVGVKFVQLLMFFTAVSAAIWPERPLLTVFLDSNHQNFRRNPKIFTILGAYTSRIDLKLTFMH